MAIAPSNTTTSRYVVRDSNILAGEPIIDGTRVTVRDIVGFWQGGTRPEDIQSKLPFVTTAQVFDALGFYLDNQSEIDEYIAYFQQYPLLNIPVGIRANPLFEEVTAYIETYHSNQNAAVDWDESDLR